MRSLSKYTPFEVVRKRHHICALESFNHVKCLFYFSPVNICNKYFWIILNQIIPNLSVCFCSLRNFVVVVCLFSLVFYCETTGCVATMWKNWLLLNKFIAHVRPEHTNYARLQKSGGTSTVCAYISDHKICIMHTVRCPSCTSKKWSIFWAIIYR